MGTATSSAFPTDAQQQQQIRTRRQSDDTTGSSLFDALARTVSRAAVVGIMGDEHDESRRRQNPEVEVEVVQQLVAVSTTTTTTVVTTVSETARVVEQSLASRSRSPSTDAADNTQEEAADDNSAPDDDEKEKVQEEEEEETGGYEDDNEDNDVDMEQPSSPSPKTIASDSKQEGEDEQVEDQEQEQEGEESGAHEDADAGVVVVSVNVEATVSSSAQEETVSGAHEAENDDDANDEDVSAAAGEDVDAEAEERDEEDDAEETRAPEEEEDEGNDDDVEDNIETTNANDEVAKGSTQGTEASPVAEENNTTQEASPAATGRAKSSNAPASSKEQGKVSMENPDEDMFDVVVKPVNPAANTTDDEDEKMPTESDEVDEVEGPHVMATKEVLVCKHCQREFAYASRGVARHKSECRVFQQRKMEESEAAAARQQEDENGDEDEKMAYNQDKDNEMIQSQVEDEEEATTSRGNAAADKDHKRAVTPGGDDGDDGESSLQGSTTTNASLADEKEASEESQCRTLTAQDPGFRIYHETGSKGRTKKRAECRSCGKSCAYTYMARHARACQKHAAALSQPSATPEPHATTPKRASKRRLAQEESPDEDVKQNDASADAEDDEAAEDDAVSMTTAKDVITPRRSKRIKHDPTQSPTEKEPQGDKTPKRLQVQMPRTTPPQTKKHTVEPHVSPHHPSISPAVVPEKTRVHFDMMLLEKGERLRCKYCGEEVRARPGVPDRHLQHCKEFDARHKRVLKIMQQHEDESMPGSGDELSVVVTEDTMTALSWLFGSIENADAMKSTYRRSPLCVKSPLSRFQQLIKDPLCELSVPKLLDIAPLTRPVTLFMNAQDVQPRRTVSAVICSKLEAQELYEAGASLSFPASESVKTLFVTPLVKDLGVSPLVNPAAHDTVLVCGRAGFHFEWHFHRSDCFVIQLKGKTRWKCDQDAIRDPLGDYHPFANNASPHGEENALKIYRTSAANRKLTLVPPAEGGDRMMHDADENENENRTEPLEVMAEPGCVVYMPSGTWCEADAIDNALWLEVRIAPISHGELVADAIRQLLWKDEKWRQPILASHDVRSNRQHLDSLLKDLHSTVSTLCSSDLLPETLVSSDRDVSHDANGPAERNMDVDLSKHEFKSDRYIKIFKTTGLRENPLAVILGRHEIVDRRLGDGNSDSVALPYHSGSPHRKKALVKKPERKPSAPVVRKMDHVDDNVYIVHVQYGNADLRSRLRVQFRCNAFQSALVEWIREHDGAAFHASDLMEAAQKMPGATSGKPSGTASSHQDEEATKYVLRFLCSIGYVSRVKLASERGEHRERT